MARVYEVGNESNFAECPGLVMADEFLPIVEFSGIDKKDKDAFDIKESANSTTLSSYLDENFQTLNPYILTTTRRKISISFNINCGNNDSYDSDGILEIKTLVSDPDIKFKPNKFNCAYGDTITVDIEYTNKKSKIFDINFYASDDSSDFNEGELSNIHCGIIQMDFLEAAEIQSVEFLDKDDNTIVSNTVNQIVNLPINQNFIDIANCIYENRLSQSIKAIVKFDKPGIHDFKVKLIADSNNVRYSSTEKSRNSNFKYMDKELALTTDKNGELIIDGKQIFVSPAGGDIFELSGEDFIGNKIKSTGKIKTERSLFYTEIKMTGLSSIASSLNVFKNEYKKYNINFKALPSGQIPHMQNIGKTDENTFKNNVNTAFNLSQGASKKPYSIAIAYTDHLAVKNPNQPRAAGNVQGGSLNPINILIEGRGLNPNDTSIRPRALWTNIVPTEDWFVECYFLKNGGNPISDKIIIPKSKCTPKNASGYPSSYFNSVDIDVSFLPPDIGIIRLVVNWVDRMRAGLSFKGTNIVAICTKAWWTNITSQEQNGVMIHEIGHQVGMTPNSSGILPDKAPTHYNTTKGHVGNHCHSGIPNGQSRYDSKSDRSRSNCVMYGATNGHSNFCSNCSKQIKKLDLCQGV